MFECVIMIIFMSPFYDYNVITIIFSKVLNQGHIFITKSMSKDEKTSKTKIPFNWFLFSLKMFHFIKMVKFITNKINIYIWYIVFIFFTNLKDFKGSSFDLL